METANHFACIDLIIENAKRPITESLIKELHRMLKNGTTDARQDWFAVGNYKKLPSTVGNRCTVKPEEVARKMKSLLFAYNAEKDKSFDDLLDFHYAFECIHPFQDGNGRTGRAIILKQCLDSDIMPVIITDNDKAVYYSALHKAQIENELKPLLDFFEREQAMYYEKIKKFIV